MRLGRYEIVRELGRGAMGAVYEARDPRIDRTVAIKTIAVTTSSPEEAEQYRKRFFREAQAAGKMSAAGIVAIYDIGEDEASNTPFIVMEFVPGQTLDQYVASQGGRVLVERALDFVQQIAAALDYAHAQGIIHRDIKPANIMVTADGHTKIADFGIAKLTAGEFTMTGQVLGTPAYMSPEQLTGGKNIDGRSDLFSLGVMAYWLLTGAKPFVADNPTSLMFQIVYKDPPPLREVNTSLGPEFDLILQRLLAKDPAARYQRGRECAADIDDLRHGLPPRSASAAAAAPTAERTAVVPVPPPAERTVTSEGAAAVMQTTPLLSLAVDPTPPLSAAPVAQPATAPVPAKSRGKFIPFAAVAAGIVLLLVAGLMLARRATGSGAGGAIGSPISESSLGNTVVASTGDARLQIVGEHSFRSAQISVWIDDQLAYQDELRGGVRSRSSLLRKSTWVAGAIDIPLKVPEGKHTVTVKIKAMAQNYLQTGAVAADFPAHSTRTLHIGFGPSGKELNLDWQ